MKTKIEKLKQIISRNIELNIYFDSVQDDWNKDKFNKFIEKIPIDSHPSSNANRDLLLLLNDYDDNETYKL